MSAQASSTTQSDNGASGAGPASPGPDGSYLGVNEGYSLRLRVDLKSKGMLSGDLQFAGASIGSTAAAVEPPRPGTGATGDGVSGDASPDSIEFLSFRTADRTHPEDVEWFPSSGARVTGRVVLDGLDRSDEHRDLGEALGPAMRAVLTVDASTQTGPERTFVFRVVWTGSTMRSLGVRILAERGVGFPETSAGQEPSETRIVRHLRDAGIRVHITRDQLPPAAVGPWQESDIFAELSRIMHQNAATSTTAPRFSVDLLALSRTDYGNLGGLMFDLTDCLPRQGAAVFLKTLEEIYPSQPDGVVTTAVHELGHALNLLHSFDPEVRRSTATTFMTYPWRFRRDEIAGSTLGPQDRAKAFWEAFDFQFDDQELRFLRHAPWSQIVPGGSPFGSARYWPDRDRSDSPGQTDLTLWLTGPPGAEFAYGQRIFIQVSLLNRSQTSITIPRHALDIKAGDLQLMLQPVTARSAPRKPFVPMMRRCFDVGGAVGQDSPGAPAKAKPLPKGLLRLGPGESIHANLNLSYGNRGPALADPGSYDLAVYLTLPPGPRDEGRDRVIAGRPLRITVLAPRNKREERDGEVLFRPDVGASLALGGSTALQRAAEDLAEIRARREWEARGPDPVVPALARSAGIQLRRQGRHREAAEQLAKATSTAALAFFDPHTADHTRRLAAGLRSRDQRSATPQTVVIDLWTKRAGGPVRSARITGFLATDTSQEFRSDGPAPEKFQSWEVLASPAHLPQGFDDAKVEVSAEITSASQDGLTERIGVSSIDLCQLHGGARPEVVRLRLSRPVPTEPIARSRIYTVDSQPGGFFGPPPDEPAQIAARHDDELTTAAATVDEALVDVAMPVLTPPAPVRAVTLQDVAIWPFCLLSAGCYPSPPNSEEPGTAGGNKVPATETPPADGHGSPGENPAT